MKKSSIVLSLILATGIAHAQESGFFIGLSAGLGLNSVSAKTSISDIEVVNNFSLTTNLTYGARLGYILAFNEMNALRIYGDFTAGNFTTAILSGNQGGISSYGYYHMTGGGGLDYLISFSESWGMFIGAGYNYAFGKFMDSRSKPNPHNPYANIGVAWNWSILRLEVGAKIPFLSWENTTTTIPITATDSIVFSSHARTNAQIYFNLDLVF
ncbi:hypothetical protein CQA53_08765 [Helicobacter didelphidarum]|uniref:Outer membrane protein beta-barrel domain-containing protein n=1 Tax=Helicobacter didelphidarum TaxID=2040648 RepID=A0A3D8IDK3_9HELI|nr:hypothetical protein [Helicobacter didelphidarum]RDU63105.1 hypothetical protein CQA53_08765 [Helicobacter didelphidarum]